MALPLALRERLLAQGTQVDRRGHIEDSEDGAHEGSYRSSATAAAKPAGAEKLSTRHRPTGAGADSTPRPSPRAFPSASLRVQHSKNRCILSSPASAA